MRTTRRALVIRIAAASVAAALLGMALGPEVATSQTDPQLVAKAGSAIDRGLKWLRTTQQPDGSYGSHLGVTALAVTALARSPRAYREEDGPFMRDAVAYIRRAAQPDGSITSGGGYEMYTTALAVIALKSLGTAKHDDLVQKAQAWIKARQTVEHLGYKPEEKFYGGFGYGSSLRPDLSNTQYAIEALRVSGLKSNDPVFAKAVTFIQRIQNRTESNDQAGALDDGGFAYYPGYSFAPAGGWTSTGSMTHAGIKSFLFLDLDPKDPRVQAAVKWIAKHYTVDENPGLGANGYYYYVDVFAKSWALMKTDTVVTADGARRDWFQDLATRLLAEQRPEGFWVNSRSPRFWEDKPELATSHAVMALSYGIEVKRAKK